MKHNLGTLMLRVDLKKIAGGQLINIPCYEGVPPSHQLFGNCPSLTICYAFLYCASQVGSNCGTCATQNNCTCAD
ncbi:MAG: hypothetical protein QM528_05460 [Phycisphaerales bacterium]|nr:hypothetical protein [Phycisphaerales bacterium]